MGRKWSQELAEKVTLCYSSASRTFWSLISFQECQHRDVLGQRRQAPSPHTWEMRSRKVATSKCYKQTPMSTGKFGQGQDKRWISFRDSLNCGALRWMLTVFSTFSSFNFPGTVFIGFFKNLPVWFQILKRAAILMSGGCKHENHMGPMTT